MNDILKIARIQIMIIVLFAIFKLIRPAVLASNTSEIIKMILLSLPNFFEGVIGVLIVTGIGLYLNNKILSTKKQLQPKFIYILAVIVASFYVITQEFKLHNLGGKNVFDINDVFFSIIGLITGFSIIIYMKPKIYNDN